MCGRFTMTAKQRKLFEKFLARNMPELIARYNIVPSQPVLTVREEPESKQRQAAICTWGLVPFWSKDPNISRSLNNARSESAAFKPAFKGPMRHHRCLIPANGFYEWKRTGNQKLPHYFQRPEGELFAIAGLWDHWGSPDGSEIESCTILTTTPNKEMASVHHRMPVIIEEVEFDRWLSTETQRASDVEDLLRPAPDGFFERYPVTDLVNNARNDGPELMQRADIQPEFEQGELFT
ncbi:SOS response-associated peptidase [Rubellicoccus peritrichatus]|uniref:Abasic site processing protein n=1 Tax=Rubellicoccus peritrichatus TaxID=3080537 RepID=A0AAQ3LAE3_9BACT|nr:SOS response-associated peptidase [Puniceicoccus sp. CR14]WOO39868.1 SOS response-associated peptidase [Puniceicoccus sp. CR14]